MQKKIWKFELPLQEWYKNRGYGPLVVKMPKRAILLAGIAQDDKFFVWAEVNPVADMEDRKFRIIFTGQPFDPDHLGEYFGTFTDGYLVLHVFEDAERSPV